MEETEYYDFDNETDCRYLGTEHVEVKIYLIGVFATLIALLSILFNGFFTLVFIMNQSIRRSSVFYFGILAVIDAIMAVNYLAVMSLPVYMDFYHYLPMYRLFLSYFRVVLTESNCAMFASMLLIVLATTERLLRTFEGKSILRCRRFVEKRRPIVCGFCIVLAIAYKLCMYWEVDVKFKKDCEEGWKQYEIIAGSLAQYESYRFWWMFLTRNLIDRILPFFALVAMNYLIIKALKKEYARRGPKQSIADKPGKANRSSLRDATRALIGIVSMYIMSQSLQVLLTFWETFDRDSLENLEVVYSYLNDIVSIMTLLSSCLRFPVYCTCNRLIYTASKQTLVQLKSVFSGKEISPNEYEAIGAKQRQELTPTSEVGQQIMGAIYDEKLQEWKL